MKNILFIISSDLRYQIRQGSTILWLFVMPPIFFYFIGTVTGGFSSGMSGGVTAPLNVVAESPGFLKKQIDLRLQENDFAPVWIEVMPSDTENSQPKRILSFDANLSDRILAGEQVQAIYDTRAGALSRDFELIRIQRSLYTVLADVVAADALSADELTVDQLVALNEKPRIWDLKTSPAGQRQEIPSGFEQAIPGILVMFTLLILLTSGASMLIVERKQGLLRRLASTPMSRSEVVAGKWGSRMVLAAIQVSVALLFGTFLFNMDWGPHLGMIMLVLIAWCGFCASAGLWLGSIAKTEAQAAGFGVLTANAMAALGGCWWPIEITPAWMQLVQKFLPTGWTMDALHKLISFQAGAFSVVPNILILCAASLVFGVLAVRRFEYQ